MTATAVDLHEGLGYAERGNRTLLGDLGHWHRSTDFGAERRHWVRGTAEACETGLSDEDLIAAIREADETFDPAPEFNLPDVHVVAEVKDIEPIVSAKPERGGKRTCESLWPDDAGVARCGHSESRHNASGTCRSCDCTDFMVSVE